VLTVDMPMLGNRERDRRNHLTMPPSPLTFANFAGMESEGHAWRTLTWDDVAWLRNLTHCPSCSKHPGPRDALKALEYGVNALVISNHGGRQLDSCVTSVEMLPEIAAAVGDRCELYLDGGIRRGTDVLKALALGARAVLVARPALWGLAVDGSTA